MVLKLLTRPEEMPIPASRAAEPALPHLSFYVSVCSTKCPCSRTDNYSIAVGDLTWASSQVIGIFSQPGCRRSARCTHCSILHTSLFYCVCRYCFFFFNLFNIKPHTPTKLKTSFSESSKTFLWTENFQIHYFQYSGTGLRKKVF